VGNHDGKLYDDWAGLGENSCQVSLMLAQTISIPRMLCGSC
jgi:hypothetical protein